MFSSILLCSRNLEALGNGHSFETGKAEISNMTTLSCISVCFFMYSINLLRFLGQFNLELTLQKSTLHSQITKKGLNNNEIEHNNYCLISHHVKEQQFKIYTEKPYFDTVPIM